MSVVFISSGYLNSNLEVVAKAIHDRDPTIKLKDWHLRKRITTTPYLHGPGAEYRIFGVYKQCNLVMGNRFHTNVCAIGQYVPTIGFVNYPQITKLYQELGLQERTVTVNIEGFQTELKKRIQFSLEHADQLVAENKSVTQQLYQQLVEFLTTIKQNLLV